MGLFRANPCDSKLVRTYVWSEFDRLERSARQKYTRAQKHNKVPAS